MVKKLAIIALPFRNQKWNRLHSDESYDTGDNKVRFFPFKNDIVLHLMTFVRRRAQFAVTNGLLRSMTTTHQTYIYR